jgi:two-component system chemotaxis family response regulator WspR
MVEESVVTERGAIALNTTDNGSHRAAVSGPSPRGELVVRPRIVEAGRSDRALEAMAAEAVELVPGDPIAPADLRRIVLLVDDDVTVAEAVGRMLAHHPEYQLEYCGDSVDAVATARELKPTVILQDLVMPEIHGLTLIKQYRADRTIKDIPVIALSSEGQPALKSEAFAVGASDYLVKLPDEFELVARIQLHSLTRLNQLQKDEAYRALHESQQQLIASHRALAERLAELQAARDELARLVSTDSLTGLYSRHRWFELSTAEFKRYQRHHRPLGVFIVDLDLFKRVNDTFGHDAGDGVLKQFANVLKLALRQSDIAGRIGGEEFAVLLPETPSDGVQMVARRIVERCRDLEVVTPAGPVKFSCSIGVAEATPDDDTFEETLRRADRALYNAKEGGRDRWTAICQRPTAPRTQPDTAA